MTKSEFTTHIPSRKIGKTQTLPYDVTCICDESGCWTMSTSYDPTIEPVLQSEVIDICEKSNNWDEIKSKYFPMHGFHN